MPYPLGHYASSLKWFNIFIPGFSAQTLLRKDNLQEKVQDPRYLNDLPTSSWLLPDAERESYERLPRKLPIAVTRDAPKTLVVFNSLAQPRQDVMAVHVSTPHVQVSLLTRMSELGLGY